MNKYNHPQVSDCAFRLLTTWRHFKLEAVLWVSQEAVVGDERFVPGSDFPGGHREAGVSLRLAHVYATNFTAIICAVESVKRKEDKQ